MLDARFLVQRVWIMEDRKAEIGSIAGTKLVRWRANRNQIFLVLLSDSRSTEETHILCG